MSDFLKNIFHYIIEGTVASFLRIPLFFIPNHHKIHEMYNEAMCINALLLPYVPDRFKTQEMCIKVVEVEPCQLYHVPDYFITNETCDQAMRRVPYTLDLYTRPVQDTRNV